MFSFFKITPKKRSVKVGKKYGILYHNPSGPIRIVFYLANLLIVVSVVYFAYLYQPLISSVISYRFKGEERTKRVSEETKKEAEEVKKTVRVFEVIIPKIAARSEVVRNISPYNPDVYMPILDENKIVHSKISDLPGQGNNNMTYLFAHSTQQNLNAVRNNSIFYLLNELDFNDPIYVSFDGNFYKYRVYLKNVVSAKDTQYLEFRDPNKEMLILQTCWPLGTNWKRLLVFAERF